MDSPVRFHARSDLPCAACRMLHRKCSHDCVLAPFFPADEPEKFVSVHKVFGASNVIKMLQMVEESRRDDAVKSIVYEAHARLKDPVHGCSGSISYLQKCVENLEVQLRTTRERVQESQEQRDELLNFLMDATYLSPVSYPVNDTSGFLLDSSMTLLEFQ